MTQRLSDRQSLGSQHGKPPRRDLPGTDPARAHAHRALEGSESASACKGAYNVE